ncbi:RNA 2'-phosphotransferase [Amycolatopsis thermophila]|uniref:RNA 2'-phosphotransferase n=1 Tax=Amycolatopsis thermophila TaxID=206084 RepID=UPI0035207D44
MVAGNDKQRFAFDESGTLIRAAHWRWTPACRTPRRRTNCSTAPLNSSCSLRPQSRHDVHLSRDLETAVRVGSRHGAPVVLTVDAAAMTRHGYHFQVSANGVWLTRVVPSEYLAHHRVTTMRVCGSGQPMSPTPKPSSRCSTSPTGPGARLSTATTSRSSRR